MHGMSVLICCSPFDLTCWQSRVHSNLVRLGSSSIPSLLMCHHVTPLHLDLDLDLDRGRVSPHMSKTKEIRPSNQNAGLAAIAPSVSRGEPLILRVSLPSGRSGQLFRPPHSWLLVSPMHSTTSSGAAPKSAYTWSEAIHSGITGYRYGSNWVSGYACCSLYDMCSGTDSLNWLGRSSRFPSGLTVSWPSNLSFPK